MVRLEGIHQEGLHGPPFATARGGGYGSNSPDVAEGKAARRTPCKQNRFSLLGGLGGIVWGIASVRGALARGMQEGSEDLGRADEDSRWVYRADVRSADFHGGGERVFQRRGVGRRA